ncbi:MAG TPA: hypothetical protein DHW82_02440 [Spirochaetia bacterium]|nr:MAG: hypothetical protein A2Y41_07940 [Spirochaetes bacterium GWB1_36_13]HCL55851.1 hypothetical protein [Spirochaetia bacterium]
MKKILPLILFILVSGHVFSEQAEVSFPDPEPYIDYEFEELQRTYLFKRKITLDTIKKIPLNQYPEEFIYELIEQVKKQTKEEVKKEILEYLKKHLKDERKSTSLSDAYNISDKTLKKKIEPKKTTVKTGGDDFLPKDKGKKEIAEEKKEPVQQETKASNENQILKFSVNSNQSVIIVNSLSNIPLLLEVGAEKNVTHVDAAIYLKSIDGNMVYLLKRFPYASIEGKKSFDFLWERPSIPFGKYKPFVEVKFFDKNHKEIASKTEFWGNSSSTQMYIIQKM